MDDKEIAELNRMADSLYYVAGHITMRSKCDNTAVKSCNCVDCDRLARVHDCMNTMEKMVKTKKEKE